MSTISLNRKGKTKNFHFLEVKYGISLYKIHSMVASNYVDNCDRFRFLTMVETDGIYTRNVLNKSLKCCTYCAVFDYILAPPLV